MGKAGRANQGGDAGGQGRGRVAARFLPDIEVVGGKLVLVEAFVIERVGPRGVDGVNSFAARRPPACVD